MQKWSKMLNLDPVMTSETSETPCQFYSDMLLNEVTDATCQGRKRRRRGGGGGDKSGGGRGRLRRREKDEGVDNFDEFHRCAFGRKLNMTILIQLSLYLETNSSIQTHPTHLTYSLVQYTLLRGFLFFLQVPENS